MALSSATQNVLYLALGWAVVASSPVVCFVYFDEIKAGLGLLLPAPEGQVSRRPAAQQVTMIPQQAPKPAGYVVEVKAGPNGHFVTTAHVNLRPITVMVDTGATTVALTYEDATRLGVFVHDRDYTGRTHTANGIARFAPVVLDSISIGDITVRNVEALVSEPGRLHISLLGMSFLGKLGSFEMRGRTLVLQQ
jgi:aspartyl protease family protein